ncbi:MAG: hypothetical protein M1814_004908 [Vezdaea aestivalis]|nr:MAG: hypothetical protein M1814_004908 [Vezdaea aestivalis]
MVSPVEDDDVHGSHDYRVVYLYFDHVSIPQATPSAYCGWIWEMNHAKEAKAADEEVQTSTGEEKTVNETSVSYFLAKGQAQRHFSIDRVEIGSSSSVEQCQLGCPWCIFD